MTKHLHTDSKYVHLQEANGYDAGVTCETLGYVSIISQDECIDAAKQINSISNYSPYPTDIATSSYVLSCFDDNPNHCFTNTNQNRIYFTRGDCKVHPDRIDSHEGLICMQQGII